MSEILQNQGWRWSEGDPLVRSVVTTFVPVLRIKMGLRDYEKDLAKAFPELADEKPMILFRENMEDPIIGLLLGEPLAQRTQDLAIKLGELAGASESARDAYERLDRGIADSDSLETKASLQELSALAIDSLLTEHGKRTTRPGFTTLGF